MRRNHATWGVAATVGFAIIGSAITSHGVSASARVYRDQFFAHQDSVQAILDRAKSIPASQSNAAHEELLAILKLVHRLGEEASSADNRKRGTDKALLLVAQGCTGLGFVIEAIENFLYTRDDAFLVFAADGMETVKSIRKFLRVPDR